MANRAGDWMRQAEGDLMHAIDSCEKLRQFDWACFAAHQAAEQALKGLYVARGEVGAGNSLTTLLGGLCDGPIDLASAEAATVLDGYFMQNAGVHVFRNGLPNAPLGESEAAAAIGHARMLIEWASRLRGTPVVSVWPGPNGRLLFLRRRGGRHDGSLAPPGGYVESGEELESAAGRELLEETGIRGDVLRSFDRWTWRREPSQRDLDVHHFFTCTDTDSVVLSEEHSGYVWLDQDEAIDLYVRAIEEGAHSSVVQWRAQMAQTAELAREFRCDAQ